MDYQGKSYNILIYGEPYEWAMAHNLRKSFKQLGHGAEIFDWTKWLYRTKKYTLKNRILDRLLFHSVAKTINNNLISSLKSSNYDMLLVLKGIHLFPGTILAAKKCVDCVANWNPDDFFNPLNNSQYLLKSFDKYDCIFTSRGHLREEYIKKGAKRFEVVNWYYRPDIFHPMELSLQERIKYERDLVFIGTWSKRRESILSSLSDFNLKVWGSHWHKSHIKFRNHVECNSPVHMKDMCNVINISRINLNILTKENRDTTNIRNFEIPACGGFQLSERSEAILELFEEDKEIVCFETVDELISKCKYYLVNDSKRERIALNGHHRLISGNHTMLDRANQILRTVFN